MKVIDFGADCETAYRYRVDVGRDNMASLNVVRVWADNNNISCAILPGLAFFHHEQDVVMFMLRWS
jgi:hypothetical protein